MLNSPLAFTGKDRFRRGNVSDWHCWVSEALDQHYLATHSPTVDDQSGYSVHDAMSDYYIERGQHLPSAAPIRARFKLLIRFLEHEQAAGSF